MKNPKNPLRKTGAPSAYERRLAKARRAFKNMERAQGRKRVLWQLRSKP